MKFAYSLKMLVAIAICIIGFAFVSEKPLLNENIILKKFAFVPTGEIIYLKKSVSIQSFYIWKTEISNAEYREFLSSLLANGKVDEYRKACPDSTKYTENQTYALKCYNHPAYSDYPVICITREGAEMFCKWIEEKVNKKLDKKVIVRIPTMQEWIYAAQGKSGINFYAWDGPYLTNSKGKWMCNFYTLRAENIHRLPNSDSFVVNLAGEGIWVDHSIFAPERCVSYYPNRFGLYNTSGNVAEMVDSNGIACGGSFRSPGYDVSVRSFRKYDLPSNEVGFRPVFTYIQ